MPRIFVLFDLQESADPDEYERWAEETDAAAVRALPSIDSFEVFRIDGALEGESPHEYVEVIEVNDMEQFQVDVGTDRMQEVAAQFQERADDPVFIVGERIV